MVSATQGFPEPGTRHALMVGDGACTKNRGLMKTDLQRPPILRFLLWFSVLLAVALALAALSPEATAEPADPAGVERIETLTTPLSTPSTTHT